MDGRKDGWKRGKEEAMCLNSFLNCSPPNRPLRALSCVLPSSFLQAISTDHGQVGRLGICPEEHRCFFCSFCHFPVLEFSNEIQAPGGSKPRASIYNYLGTNWYKR